MMGKEQAEIKDFIENIIIGRIQMLVQRRPEQGEQGIVDEAEQIIKDLEAKKREAMERFLDAMMNREAESEVKIYRGGFKDGLAVATWLSQMKDEYSECFAESGWNMIKD